MRHSTERKHKSGKFQKAFTIIELMVVVVILGLLATAVVVNVTGHLAKSRRERARLDIANLKNAMELFYVENHHYPGNEEGFSVLLEKTSTYPAGIISQLPNDPWGRSYQYLYPGRHDVFDIYSFGRDGSEGGEAEDADVQSWALDSGQENKQ